MQMNRRGACFVLPFLSLATGAVPGVATAGTYAFRRSGCTADSSVMSTSLPEVDAPKLIPRIYRIKA